MTIADMLDLKIDKCPFCSGNATVSFKDYQFVRQNYYGDKKLKYRIQVICNRCKSRGAPVVTDALLNPNPYKCTQEQITMFEPYVHEAVKKWNNRPKSL